MFEFGRIALLIIIQDLYDSFIVYVSPNDVLLKDAIEISFYCHTHRRSMMGKTSEKSLCVYSCVAKRPPPVFLRRRTQKEGVNVRTTKRYCPLLLCVTLLMDSFVSEVLELPCAKNFHLDFEK